ncbi:anthranilate synthase family protein [Catenuloplanes atrovinosus]|uniref:anthranilate synthase n=1 Tax=Catenuloplanes atrovinosus TaxID=137266 RepID=A0AAE3YU06_9ACTN|nr:anthranilate synthase family protein [Catenuloplanes atrovinosus]MDR7277866.1 phenazine biosynthesis protein phzE [Catenuloplanes atrovinosus]
MFTEIITGDRPFALLRREGADQVEVFTGRLTIAGTLAELPLDDRTGPQTLALVPYRQIVERGFDTVDDGTPMECLRIDTATTRPLDEVVGLLPDTAIVTVDAGFDVGDAAYARTVEEVLRDEIGRGEGANFVVHRTFRATVRNDPRTAALTAFRNLLTGERGAYWTFLIWTGTRYLVGATPERHVSVDGGLVMMNPISGTFRHAGGGDLRAFLDDPKERDELYMVLDEELKMMATVAEAGGQVLGPYLKEMSHLTHTEYLLAGRTARDVRDVLRETMFAPTVTGSPIENAARVIARHERRGRRYYAGVLALLGRDADGGQSLDAPILIRTAELSPEGEVRVPVGATLVRHSTPAGEVAETYAKAAGVLSALGLRPRGTAPAAEKHDHDHPAVRRALAARNDRLARFWLDDRATTAPEPVFAGRRALIVDGEDTFTGMLAHQLRALGLDVMVRPWSAPGPDVDTFDLVVPGPGPGDPTDPGFPPGAALRALIADLLAEGRPMLAVCLSHQVLSDMLGLRLHRRDAPYQGIARDVSLFGRARRVGFYSTYTALADADEITTRYGRVELARDPADGAVHALRGPGFAGVQFHPESVLSEDGLIVLTDLLTGLMPGTPGRAAEIGSAPTQESVSDSHIPAGRG